MGKVESSCGGRPTLGGAAEQEQLLLTQKERDRLKVLHEVQQCHLTQAAAAEQLGISIGGCGR